MAPPSNAVKVVNITEGKTLGPGNTLQNNVILKYMVGGSGPFTLITTESEIQSGAALQKMQAFANTLGNLPQ